MNFKHNWKKILTLLTGAFALVLILTACGSGSNSNKSELKEQGTLTIGMEGSYKPYGYRGDNGKLTGFEADLARDVAKKLDLKPKFVLSKWDGLIAGLGSSKYDVVFNNISSNKQRQENFNLSEPYIYSRSNLITKDTNKNINNIKDIKGKKMAEGTGTNNQLIAEKFGAQTVPSSQFATTLDLIREGRVDGAVNSTDAWHAYAQSNSTKGLKQQEVPTSEQPATAVSALLSKQSPDLTKKITKAINELRDDGTLAKLSNKYFGDDITKKP